MLKVNRIAKADLKNLMESTYNAISNFQIRALYEGKDEILKYGRFTEDQFNYILDSYIDAETERNLVYKTLIGLPPLTLDEVIEKVDYDKEKLIPAIEYLVAQGYLDRPIEEKTRTKQVKLKDGTVKDVEEKYEIVRYQAKKIDDLFRENYFDPVSLVFEAGACCNCGYCSSICPVGCIQVSADSLEIDKEKCIKCGLCFSVCPRSFPTRDVLRALNRLNPDLKDGGASNYYISAYSASTMNDKIKEVRQDGGIVSTIIQYLLKENKVDAALAVMHSEDLWKPMPVLIESDTDVYKTAGTKYANAPSLNILDEALKYERLAVVGTPCMMLAIKKGNTYPAPINLFENIKYTIGLFCMESFSYNNIIKICTEVFDKKLEDVVKMDISGGKFIVKEKSGEEHKVPLKEVTSFARGECHYCDDLTSEYADISIGSIGSGAGWSSVITRTKAGDDLFNEVIKAGLVEVKDLAEVKPGFFLVKKISGSKSSKCHKVKFNKDKE